MAQLHKARDWERNDPAIRGSSNRRHRKRSLLEQCECDEIGVLGWSLAQVTHLEEGNAAKHAVRELEVGVEAWEGLDG